MVIGRRAAQRPVSSNSGSTRTSASEGCSVEGQRLTKVSSVESRVEVVERRHGGQSKGVHPEGPRQVRAGGMLEEKRRALDSRGRGLGNAAASIKMAVKGVVSRWTGDGRCQGEFLSKTPTQHGDLEMQVGEWLKCGSSLITGTRTGTPLRRRGGVNVQGHSAGGGGPRYLGRGGGGQAIRLLQWAWCSGRGAVDSGWAVGGLWEAGSS